MTKLKSSYETVIALIFMVMNMDKLIHFLSLYHFVIIHARDLCKERAISLYHMKYKQLFTDNIFSNRMQSIQIVIIQ